MTLFSLLLHAGGLSQREAAGLLNVRLDTVKSWSAGRNRAPDRVLAELAALAVHVEEAAKQGARLVEEAASCHGAPDAIELGYAADDAEAQTLGWPCVGAHFAALGRIASRAIAKGYRTRLVPRGSTIATAGATERGAACDAVEKT